MDVIAEFEAAVQAHLDRGKRRRHALLVISRSNPPLMRAYTAEINRRAREQDVLQSRAAAESEKKRQEVKRQVKRAQRKQELQRQISEAKSKVAALEAAESAL